MADTDWRRGYRTDIEYTFGFYPVLNPDELMLTATLCGVRPPAAIQSTGPGSRGLSYCELGCGQGVTTNILAARDPDGTYVGVDYNPAQIRNARAMAAAARLDNVRFVEESFADLARHDLPDFDIVVLHGIYSWVDVDIRRSIVDFLRTRLKAGGVCYISYNCAVGRGGDMAMRELLRAERHNTAGSPDAQAAAALKAVQELAGGDSRYFKAHPSTKGHLKDLSKHNPSYIVHEYYNDHWQPFFFREVAADMDGAKLAYVGNADWVWNRTDLCLDEVGRRQHGRMQRTEDRELIKDVWANQRFRRDIYAKGAAVLATAAQQATLLSEVHFRLTKPAAECSLSVQVPAGSANLPQQPFQPMIDALADGPASGAALRRLFATGDDGERRFVRALEVLLAVRHVQLATHPEARPVLERRFADLGAGIRTTVDGGTNLYLLPNPATGLVSQLGPLEYFLALAHREDPARRVARAGELLLASGRGVNAKPGQAMADAVHKAFAGMEQGFDEKLRPALERDGVI